MKTATPRLVTLRAGDTVVDLAPAIGGAVARFSWRGVDVFRPATQAAIDRGDVLGMANFPMVPFAGRIRQGLFAFDGRDVRLPANLRGESDAIHGQGWRSPWTVVEATETMATLRYDHPADSWPWAYRAEQTFILADGAFVHRLTVTNRSPSAMPAGLGLHPYFARRSAMRLRAPADGVFLDPRDPPVPPPPAWDWRGGAAIDAFVDHQFRGWDGAARLTWPHEDLTLALTTEPPASRFVVYAPIGEAYVCVEPVTHQLDAVNRSAGGAQHGMARLAMDEPLSLTARFTVSAGSGVEGAADVSA